MEDLRVFVSELEQGAMKNVPCYENHSRGKNWMAKIKIDPHCPNGMDRSFCKRANGGYYYFVDSLKVNEIVEFGADYYTGSYKKCSKREYGVIINLCEESIHIALFESHHDAFHFVKKNFYDSNRELLLEKEILEKRLSEINQKLAKNGTID